MLPTKKNTIPRIAFHVLLVLLLIALFRVTKFCLAQNSPKDYLAVHNMARAMVGVPPLAWNGTVAAYAEAYANQRAHDCALEHSNGPYGENLAEGFNYGDGFSGVDGVKLWLDEKSMYDYGSNSCRGGGCLHYTQVVWRDSVHLGCARVECLNENGGVFITCNYDPPGNYIGERPY